MPHRSAQDLTLQLLVTSHAPTDAFDSTRITKTLARSPPYGNATSTVKNRNDGSPPSGTSLHFHLILELQLTTPTKFIPLTLMRGT